MQISTPQGPSDQPQWYHTFLFRGCSQEQSLGVYLFHQPRINRMSVSLRYVIQQHVKIVRWLVNSDFLWGVLQIDRIEIKSLFLKNVLNITWFNLITHLIQNLMSNHQTIIPYYKIFQHSLIICVIAMPCKSQLKRVIHICLLNMNCCSNSTCTFSRHTIMYIVS